MIWLPSGVGLGIFVVWGEAYWPIILAAAMALNFSGYHSFTAALLVGISSVFEGILGARLLKRLTKSQRPNLATVREVLVFTFFVLGVSTLLSSLLSVSGLYLMGRIPAERLLLVWKVWWFSDTMGSLTVGSALIYFFNDIRFRLKSYRLPEFTLLFILVLLVSVFIYTPLSNYNHTLIIRPYILFPLMIWVTLRFDTLGVVTVNTVVMIMVLIGRVNGVLPTGTGTVEDRMFIHQLIALSLGVMGQILAAAVREKEEALTERKAIEKSLHEAIIARDEFMSIASHELKTPLTSLSLNIQMVKQKINVDTNTAPPLEKIAKIFDVSKRQIDRLSGLVEDLMDASRIRTGKFNINPEQVNLSEIVTEMTDRLTNEFAKAKILCTTDIDKDILGNFDPLRLEQVIDNLLTNAIKYAPENPLKVTLKKYETFVQLTVEDQGRGIPLEKQAKIFERFERATPSMNISGLGLGLFIAKEIVEGHAGKIRLESTPGKGSTFIVDLPLDDKLKNSNHFDKQSQRNKENENPRTPLDPQMGDLLMSSHSGPDLPA